MKLFSINISSFYLSDLHASLTKSKDKISESIFRNIDYFLNELGILLDKRNDLNYWIDRNYIDFENSLSNLGRVEIQFLNQILSEFDMFFDKNKLRNSYNEIKKKMNKQTKSQKGRNGEFVSIDNPFDSEFLDVNSDNLGVNNDLESARSNDNIRRGSTSGFRFKLDLSGIIKKRYKEKITFLNLKDDWFVDINLEGKNYLKEFFDIIGKFKEGIKDDLLINQFIVRIDKLSKHDIEYLESVYQKKFDKETIKDGLFEYINANKYIFEQSSLYGNSSEEKKMNKRRRTRGGRSNRSVENTAVDGFFDEIDYYARTINIKDLIYGDRCSGSEKINQLFVFIANLEKNMTDMNSVYYFEQIVDTLDERDIHLIEKFYNAKFDRNLLKSECKSLVSGGLKLDDELRIPSKIGEITSGVGYEFGKRNVFSVQIDYPSIISFVELKTGYSILDTYKEYLNKLLKEGFSKEIYIKKSNILIDEILLSLNFDKEKIAKVIQEHFCLNFDSSKSSSEIVDELIGDELRYYQQLSLPNNLKMDDLGNSRIIKKGIIEEDGMLPVMYGEIRNDNKASYRFDMKIFEGNKFSIIPSNGTELSKTTVERLINNNLFVGDVSGLEVISDYGERFIIANNNLDYNRNR